ncbi:YoaK family protein [Bradyrhizobium guangxiense]|uniref:YoaK family protein n=1 Tax=Bradyrhizobium guangxiense TaxID=1325115 RepID=UPI00100928E3|nr:YoaK family protein [Bradyrhizobium guangxiense]
MSIQAASPEPAAGLRAAVFATEYSLPVAVLLTMSGGFLDAFTWLSLGGVFASSQTGNVVFLGIDALSGQWQRAAHHLLPIVVFLLGAWVAIRIQAPLRCLVVEIICLAAVMLLLHRIPDPVAILGVSFGVALQSASFRRVGRWSYLSVTVTGNMLRAIDEFVSPSDRDASHGGGAMLVLCLMFLCGAAIGGFVTTRLGAASLAVPIALSACALLLCRRNRISRDPG